MQHMVGRTRLAKLFAVILLFTASTSALAQEPELGTRVRTENNDPRWRPWLGCWQLWEEQLDPSAVVDNNETATLLGRTSVCMSPSHSGDGITLTATAGERVLVERVLIADGSPRDVRDTDCTGWEERAWSFDGRRLFTHAELQCGNTETRRVNGVSFLSSPSAWVDIQVIEIETRQYIEVRRYYPAPATEREKREKRLGTNTDLGVGLAEIRRARRDVSRPIVLRDVIEASKKTNRRVVETLLVETEPRLALDADALIKLDDVGISGGVIDLLVALSYPERFVVERRDRDGSWVNNRRRGFAGFHDPIWYNNFYYPYYVTPMGYYYWNRLYNPYLIGGLATPFVVVSTGGVGGYRGRAVHERGYTRVWTQAEGASERQAAPRGEGTASPKGYSRAGSSNGTATRGGSSGSSDRRTRGGSSTGRQAVPRK